MRVVAEKLRTLPPVTIYEPEYVEQAVEAGDPNELTIEHLGNTWVVTGAWLERLVQKLLKLITLEQAPELRTSSVPELLERVKESTADALTQRGVTLQMECHAERLDMDADLMQSVLVNLVDNAGKASQPGQTVSLTADAAGFFEEVEQAADTFFVQGRNGDTHVGYTSIYVSQLCA